MMRDFPSTTAIDPEFPNAQAVRSNRNSDQTITPTFHVLASLDCDHCPQNAAAIARNRGSGDALRLMPSQRGRFLDALCGIHDELRHSESSRNSKAARQAHLLARSRALVTIATNARRRDPTNPEVLPAGSKKMNSSLK
jgi:hypothetical protein